MSNKQIPQERWVEFFDQFTNGNRKRLIKLEIVDRESGDLVAIKNAPLWSLVYDPVDKGNDLTIETGRDEVNYAHTVLAPKIVWERQDSNGKVTALEIIDEGNTQTILHLK
ncbi:DUF5335 family protein [Pleurocapsales cyanobacterium LEGE 10410]|nr:DUF5335 family protein [Pleurocapsales cyanobacterium LEGE 10410]